MIFVEDNTSVGNDLEMRLSGRNKGALAVVVEESSKSSSYNDGDEPEEQVGNHLVANEEATQIPQRMSTVLRDLAKMKIS